MTQGKSDHDFLLALGANLPSEAGAPVQTLEAAIAQLSDHGVTVAAVSRFFSTPCFPPGAGPDYVNAAALCRAPFAAEAILTVLHKVEAVFGRERVRRWGQRTLDLDLIAVGDLVLPDPATHARWRALSPEAQRSAAPDRLILPHPRLQDRAFVLVPLADVAPDWRHPVLGRTVAQMCADLPDEARAEIAAL